MRLFLTLTLLGQLPEFLDRRDFDSLRVHFWRGVERTGLDLDGGDVSELLEVAALDFRGELLALLERHVRGEPTAGRAEVLSDFLQEMTGVRYERALVHAVVSAPREVARKLVTAARELERARASIAQGRLDNPHMMTSAKALQDVDGIIDTFRRLDFRAGLAQALLVRGQDRFWGISTEERCRKAIESLEAAIREHLAIEDRDGAAWAASRLHHQFLALRIPYDERLKRIRAARERAVELAEGASPLVQALTLARPPALFFDDGPDRRSDAVAAFRRLRDFEPLEVATRLSMAFSHFIAGREANGLAQVREVEVLTETTLDPYLRGDYLEWTTVLWRRTNRLQFFEAAERARASFEALSRPMRQAEVLLARAEERTADGDVDLAESDLGRAETLLEEARKVGEDIESARRNALLARAELFITSGRYEEAAVILLQLRPWASTDKEFYGGVVFLSLARVHFELGDIDKAFEYLDEGEPHVAVHLYRAELLIEVGNYREALEILVDFPAEGGAFALRRYSLLARASERLGELEKALRYARKVDEMADPFPTIHQGPTVGEILIRLGRYDEGERYFDQRARDSAERGLLLLEADAWKNLGRIAQLRQEPATAEPRFHKALELYRRTEDRVGEAESLVALGENALARSRFAEARRYFEGARAKAERHRLLELAWRSDFGLGRLSESSRRSEEAIHHYQRAVETIESIWERLALSEPGTRFFEDKVPVYDALVALLSREGRAEGAFDYAERRRARAFLEMMTGVGARLRGELPRQLESEKARMERLMAGRRAALRSQLERPFAERSSALVARLERDLESAQQQYADVLRRISIARPRSGFLQPLTATEVRERVVEPDRILIEYQVGEEVTLAFVVTEDAVASVSLPVGRRGLAERIERLRRPFQDFQQGRIDLLSIEFDLELAHELYRLLFQPLESYLRPGSGVILVPDDVLWYLPFEALSTEAGKGAPDPGVLMKEYEGRAYLLDRYVISYAPSASLLDPALSPDGRGSANGLLAFGNPTAGASDDELPVEREIRSALSPWAFTSLPDAEDEVQRIRRWIEGERATVLVGPDARESRYKREAGSYRFVHFATHGVVSAEEPLYSTLVLAPEPEGREDGLLQSFEIFETRLLADLVVLSACDTALGPLRRGDGLVNLSRSFLYAGASSVVVSLWSATESASRLMDAFYRRLARGDSKSDALREAKRETAASRMTLAGGYELSLANPFFWSPFVLVGAPE